MWRADQARSARSNVKHVCRRAPYSASRTPYFSFDGVRERFWEGSARGRRQICNQSHRHRQLVELEVRPEESNRAIRPRLSRNLDDFDARFFERILRFHLEAHVVVHDDIVVDPAIEEPLDL